MPETPAAQTPPCRPFTLDRPPAAAAPPAGPTGPLSPVETAAKKWVGRILADERAVDRGLDAAMRGRSFTPQELIVLQAKVIQYSQELEVASRVVEKGTAAVKQVLGTQV